MTNVISPFGFQDLTRRGGASPDMSLTRVNIASSDPTPIFDGDLVQNLTGVSAGGTVQSGSFGEYITQASSGYTGNNVAYRGIFRGCEYISLLAQRSVYSKYWPGANNLAGGLGAAGIAAGNPDPVAYIQDDDKMLVTAQVGSLGSSTVVAVVGSSNIGQNIGVLQSGVSMTSTIGNPATGLSGVALASSTIGTSSSLPFRIMDFFSNWAPGGLLPQSQTPAAVNTVALGGANGTDNINPGQILVLQFNSFMNKQLTGA